MTRTQILALATVATLAAGTGCVSCQPHGFVASVKAYDRTGIPLPVRQRVHLFLMNGADPTESAGLCKLRDKVCEAGFSKVYVAQRMDANWYEREVRRVALDDPSARIILLGVDTAADKVLPLAAGAVEDGVNVDAVVILNPVQCGEIPAETPYRTVVFRSPYWKVGKQVIGAENVVVQKAWHVSLANTPAVVEAVIEQMVASAQKVNNLPSDPLPQTPLSDTPNPTPRPVDPATFGGTVGEWNFLLAPVSLAPLPPLAVVDPTASDVAPATPPATDVPAPVNPDPNAAGGEKSGPVSTR